MVLRKGELKQPLPIAGTRTAWRQFRERSRKNGIEKEIKPRLEEDQETCPENDTKGLDAR